MPSVAKPMAATAPRWAAILALYAERVAGQLAAASGRVSTHERGEGGKLPERFRTPLTQRNRKRARSRRAKRVRSKPLEKVCRRCRKALGNLERTYCVGCRGSIRAEQAAAGRAKLERLRLQGEDKRSSRKVRERKSRATDQHNRAKARWEETHPGDHDPEVFGREIAPQLKHLTGRELVDATGLSLVYCNQAQRGQRVPHSRHWDALRKVAKKAPAVGQANPAYYWQVIQQKLPEFTPQEIADATGLSVSYCKKLRMGTRMPGVRWWGELGRLGERG